MNEARAESLNRHCACESRALTPGSAFHASVPVFVGQQHVSAMRELVSAIHAVTALPAWQRIVLESAPASARVDTAVAGVFHGFDFHVTAEGPRLIEINTNAGGAMINATAEWQHPSCCTGASSGVRLPPSRAALEAAFVSMFHDEWRLGGKAGAMRTIAIVDDQPPQQFLHAEFLAFAALFGAQGIDACVVDAAELDFAAGELTWRGKPIDLVYNRLTDFYLEQPSHQALRQAWQTQAAVITPHPRAHALLANKRNLAWLTDAALLRTLGASESDIAILQARIPLTRLVQGSEADWWRERDQWFFKPESGHGSRGAYRGDKITRRVFAEVMKGSYVAQRIAPAGERRLHGEASTPLKVDLRAYVYQGQVQLMAARLYQGQTTNFRTPGGGFAPVLELIGSQGGFP